MTIDSLIQTIKSSTQHRHVYHFTDESNLPSIDQMGLVSKARMRAEGLRPHATGGNQLSHNLDAVRGIDGYVSLCFTQNHPMHYLAQGDGRLPNPRYLGIRPEVLNIDGAQIALGVANATEVTIMSVADALPYLDIEVIYTRTNWADTAVQQRLRAAERFEILIPDNVPRAMIAGVF